MKRMVIICQRKNTTR